MERGKDYYATLGVPRTCSQMEIRGAYRRLAIRWHPDKCAGSVDPEIAKRRFQAIQEAYAVLSDEFKKFLYDAGLYEEEDDDDDDDYGMDEFISELTGMMGEIQDQNNSVDDLQSMLSELANSCPPFCDQKSSDLFGGMCHRQNAVTQRLATQQRTRCTPSL